MKKFNLIATSDQINISRASTELWIQLRAIGDESPRVNRSQVRGVVKGQTNLNPVEAIQKLRSLLRGDPSKFKSIYRVIPIEEIVESDVDEIIDAVKRLSPRIGKNDRFRVTLEKRKTNLRSLDVIKAVAEVIDCPVDLKNPDWVILIEILGKETGVSVIRPVDILNIQKEKYFLSSEREERAPLDY
jgi:tRNA acetyltransferase TAN1